MNADEIVEAMTRDMLAGHRGTEEGNYAFAFGYLKVEFENALRALMEEDHAARVAYLERIRRRASVVKP
jgi:hypothetical protein